MAWQVVTELIASAARTAAKAAGPDPLVVKTITGQDLRRLGKAMTANAGLPGRGRDRPAFEAELVPDRA